MASEHKSESTIRKWLRRLYIGVRGYFALIGLMITLLPMVIMCSLTTTKFGQWDGGMVKAPVKLGDTIDLSLTLKDSIAEGDGDFVQALFAKFSNRPQPMRLPEIRRALRHAIADERVKSLAIDVGTVNGSATDFTELRRLLMQFRDSGKKLTILLTEASDWHYYIGSTADQLLVNPTTSLMIPGPVFRFVYLGEAMRKIGIDFELVRAGKFKSAAEPLIQNEPSPATLEQYGAMESALRQHWIAAIAAGRKQDAAKVAGWLKQAIYAAPEAITEGLIDGTEYASAFKGATKLRDYIDASGAEAADKAATVTSSGGIAFIQASGNIVMTDDGSGGDAIAPEAMLAEIQWASDEDDVKAVVLRIDSPGGSATASDIIWADLRDLAAQKPLIVSMGSVAASGGYYIAAPAKKIFAEPTTITGSIGVFGVMPTFEAFRDKYGVSFHIVTASDRAALLDPGRKSTAFDKALLETGIDQVYKIFLERVASGRKLPLAAVEKLAQGRVYTGQEALDLKLVDELGGLNDAFKAAKQLAGFDVDKLYPILRHTDDGMDISRCFSSPSRLRRCFGGVHSSLIATGLLPAAALQPFVTGAEHLLLKARVGEVFALAPFLPVTQF